MKKKIALLSVFLIIICISYTMYYKITNTISHPFTSSKSDIEVKIKNGDTLYSVLNDLKSKNVIGNTYIIKWYVKKNNLNTAIKPGSYLLSTKISLEELIKNLNSGKYNENAVKVTIPEGCDIERIAIILDEKGIISKENFLNSCKAYVLPDFIKKDAVRKYSLEGFLFPDTYELVKGMSGEDIIDIMVKRFDAVVTELQKDNSSKLSKEDLDKTVTMASVIEWEAKANSERKIVASVFYNRLKINMKLQSCATVEYSLGEHKSKLSIADTKVNSPYNTYLNSGLPVGPICSPGRESMEAAMHPSATNYLYFVSKNDGTHFFTNDYNKFLEVSKATQGN